MNRRGFLGSILALGAAPAIVRADSLMRVVPPGLLVDVAPPVVLMDFNSVEFALSIDEFARRYIEPAMRTLVSGIERDIYSTMTRNPGDTIRFRAPHRYQVRL